MTAQPPLRGTEAQTEQVREALSEMGGLAASQTSLAVAALLRHDLALAAKVIEADDRIDALRARVDEISTALLNLRSPLASDLRATLVAMKVASNLERIGDNARSIARRVAALLEHGSIPPVGALHRMARECSTMVEAVVDAYFERAPVATSVTSEWLTEIRELEDGVFRLMLTYMLESPRNISPATHMIFIANSLEHVVDHARNIAAAVDFLVTGAPEALAKPS